MISYLRSSRPGVIFFIVLVALLIWLPGLFYQAERYGWGSVSGPLSDWMLAEWAEQVPGKLIMMILTITYAFLAVHLNTRFNFIPERTYFPALFTATLSAAIPGTQMFHPVILAGFFLYFALKLLFQTYRYNGTSFHFFRAAILIGLGSLFYPPLIVFFLLIYVAQFVLRTFNWREWLTPLIGIFLPFYFYVGIYFIVTGEWEPLPERFVKGITVLMEWEDFTLAHFVFFGYLALMILVSSLGMIARFTTRKVSSRLYLVIIFWTFVISLAGYFLIPAVSVEILLIVALPVSYLFSSYFTISQPVWKCEVLLWGYLMALVYLQISAYVL